MQTRWHIGWDPTEKSRRHQILTRVALPHHPGQCFAVTRRKPIARGVWGTRGDQFRWSHLSGGNRVDGERAEVFKVAIAIREEILDDADWSGDPDVVNPLDIVLVKLADIAAHVSLLGSARFRQCDLDG
jgi:hypothetical protein